MLLRFVLHAAAEVKAVDNGEDGDFSRCRMWCSKVHARHQEQRIALIELRVLRVLPRQRFHVIRIFDRRRKARPPHNYLTVLRARREHFSAVREAHVEHLVRVLRQYFRQHDRHVVAKSFVLIEPTRRP